MDRKKYRYRYRVTVLVIMIAAGIFFSMKAVSLIFYTSLLIECFGCFDRRSAERLDRAGTARSGDLGRYFGGQKAP